MPYVLKPNELFVRDTSNGGYLPQNVIATQTADEQIELVEAAGAEEIEDIRAAGAGTIADVEQAVSDSQAAVSDIETRKDEIIADVQQAVADSQAAVANIDSQRNTMIAAIASVAGQGTDTTLSQSGVAADAAACGDLKSAIIVNNSRIVETGDVAYLYTWERGEISGGSESSSTKRVRTVGYYSTDIDYILINSGWYVWVFYYDSSYNYQSAGSAWQTGKIMIDSTQPYYRLCMKNTNSDYVFNNPPTEGENASAMRVTPYSGWIDSARSDLQKKIARRITLGCSYYGLYNINSSGQLAGNNARSMSQSMIYSVGDIIKSESSAVKFKIAQLNDDGSTYSFITDNFISEYTVEKNQILRVVCNYNNGATITNGKAVMDNITIDFQMFQYPLQGCSWELTNSNRLAFHKFNSTANQMMFIIDADNGDTVMFPPYVTYTSVIDNTGVRLTGSIENMIQPITESGIVIAQVRNTTSSAFTENEVYEILKNIEVVKPNKTEPIQGYGERIYLNSFSGMAKYKMSLKRYPIDENAIQGLAVYGNTLFQLYNAGICNVYNLATRELIGSYTLDGAESADHCGNASFGTAFFNDGDDYPALYSSGNLSTYQCKVYQVTASTSALKQVIDFSALTTGTMNGSAVVVSGNKMYYVQRSTTYGNNYLTISELNTPELTAGEMANGIRTVTITSQDIDRTITTAESIVNYQDATINDGKLYIIGGPSPTTITVFSLETGERLSNINISSVCNNQEPEGIDVYEDTLLISFIYCYAMQFYF